MKWHPTSWEMVPNVISAFFCRLFISTFFQFAFYLPISLSVISTSLAQPCCKCCNLSVSVVLNVRFTTNGMCMKNNTHIFVVRTGRNRMSTTCDLYPATMWIFAHKLSRLSNRNNVVLLCDQDVKVMPGATWTDDPRHNSNRDPPFD